MRKNGSVFKISKTFVDANKLRATLTTTTRYIIFITSFKKIQINGKHDELLKLMTSTFIHFSQFFTISHTIIKI